MAERDIAGKRVIWYGTLTFGLVTVPVGLTVGQGRKDVGFNQLHKGCGSKINLVKRCSTHGVDLSTDEIVKGWQYEKGEWVVVDEDELEALAPVGSTSIVINRFVPLATVDPMYVDRSYFLTAAKEEAERHGYAILLAAMRETGMAAVAKFVLWGRENLCLVRPDEAQDALVLDTLFYAEDVRDPVQIATEVSRVKVADAELDMAVQLIQGLSDDAYDPSAYPNEHRERVRDHLEQLVKGHKPKVKKPAPSKATPDVMAGLKASVAAIQKERGKAARSTKPTKSTPRGKTVAARAKAARAKPRAKR